MSSKLFTNADYRLRPRIEPEGYSFMPVGSGQHRTLQATSYLVGPSTFPELYERLRSFEQRAKLNASTLVIKPHFSRVSYDDGVLTIGLDVLNRHTYDDIEFAIAHELGHGWRAQHPSNPMLPRLKHPLSGQRYVESEADIFAGCLLGNSPKAANALQHFGEARDSLHPPTPMRVENILATDSEQCATFGLPTKNPARSGVSRRR